MYPWGTEGNHNLHWFALSDGCYWLRVGDAELFRVSPSFTEIKDWQSDCDPYVDYFVVRLWEDLLEILPAVLTPVPAPLREKLAALNLEAWYKKIFRWFDRNEDLPFETECHATEWLRTRHLYSGHLRYSPIIWLWSDETHVHIEWDNRDRLEQDVPVWDAQLGSYSLPRADFLSEVHSFRDRFLSGMQTRVDQLRAGWDRPEIAIYLDDLVKSQAYRQAEFEQALALVEQVEADDWVGILEVAALIEADADNP
jgi:hypothetical protein